MQLKWQIAEIIETVQETSQTKSLIFDVPEWQGHFAGQHIDIRLTAEDGYQVERSYSISSPPENGQKVAITVEKVEDGEVSPYLTDIVEEGDKLELRGPIGGYFVWKANQTLTKPLLLIAGGSGIVPLMSMLRHRNLNPINSDATLIYSAKTSSDIIFYDELNELAEKDGTLKTVFVVTREQPVNWQGYARRIDLPMFEEVLGKTTNDFDVFICGPTAFVEAAADLLREFGISPQNIKTERFG